MPVTKKTKTTKAAREREATELRRKIITTPPTALSPNAPRAQRNTSRAERWQSAVNKAVIARSDLDDAISTLADLRQEFEDWRDSMPDNLHGSPTYEKLDAVCDLDIDRDAVLDPLDFLDEADGIDLPLGLGRD